MKAFTLLACTLLLATPVLAEPPSKEAIDHLLKASNVEQLLVNVQQQVDTAMRNAMTQAVKQQGAGEDADLFAEAFSKKMSSVMKDELSWEKMRGLYSQVYSESFTQEEVDGLIAFYESPSGKAFIAKMPTVMQKSMTLMQERLAPVMQRLQAGMQETIEEVQKKKAK